MASESRLRVMDATTPQPQLEFRRLYSAYQDAWKRLRIEADLWQSLSSNGIDGAAIEEARNRVVRAEACYRENRNKVAEYMMAKSALAKPTAKGPVTGEIRVDRLAYRLWEEAGRRHGNAEADWYRAENMVHKLARKQELCL